MNRIIVASLLVVFGAFFPVVWAEEKETPNYYEISLVASNGDAVTQYNMGVLYQSGRGVEQSFEKAVEWFPHSADQGYENAQYNLGVMYLNGTGVTQNQDAAIEWFKKAAAQNNLSAIQTLEILAKPVP